MGFADKIEHIKKSPAGKRGSLFEDLAKKTLDKEFKRIEEWSQYAKKHAKYTIHDIGIDLVAYDSENTKHAIQCKYRSEGAPSLRKRDIDSFLSACHAHKIEHKILAYVGPSLKPNVLEACRGITIYRRKKLARLYNRRDDTTNMKWNFPPTNGGIEYAFNQAGIELFGGRQNQQRERLPKQVIDSTVRELIQNSLDAKLATGACLVTIKHDKIDPDTIAATDLNKHMKACEAQNDHPNFFKNAYDTLNSAQIDVIRVTDSNTTGLTKDRWQTCVNVEGRSVKDSETAGGSFGLGKNASFAMAGIGVVCYATKLPHIVGGGVPNTKSVAKCRAISHKLKNRMLQHVGELDSYNQILARPGTSITIVGTRHIISKRSWKREFEEAVKRNFFIAIANGNLECSVVGNRVKIDESIEDVHTDKRRKTIPSHLVAVSMYGSGSDSGSGGTYHKHVVQSGELSFDVWIAVSVDNDRLYDNCCMYVNRNGMLITDEKSRKRNPFHTYAQSHGSFLVLVMSADVHTEKHMRFMEPPSHREIDVSRSPEYKTALRKIRKDIETRIHAILFADSDQDDITELTDLADILPIKQDAGVQAKLDAFVRKPRKKRGDMTVAGGGTVQNSGGGSVKSGNGGGKSGNSSKAGGNGIHQEAIRLNDIRMISDSSDNLCVFSTLSSGMEWKTTNIIIKRVAESKEYDKDGGRLRFKTANANLVGEGNNEPVAVAVIDDGRMLAISAKRGAGKRLRLDVTLHESEPVRCAYEVEVVP